MKRGPLTIEFECEGRVIQEVTLPASMHRRLRRMARSIGEKPAPFIRKFVRRALTRPLAESLDPATRNRVDAWKKHLSKPE